MDAPLSDAPSVTEGGDRTSEHRPQEPERLVVTQAPTERGPRGVITEVEVWQPNETSRRELVPGPEVWQPERETEPNELRQILAEPSSQIRGERFLEWRRRRAVEAVGRRERKRVRMTQQERQLRFAELPAISQSFTVAPYVARNVQRMQVASVTGSQPPVELPRAGPSTSHLPMNRLMPRIETPADAFVVACVQRRYHAALPRSNPQILVPAGQRILEYKLIDRIEWAIQVTGHLPRPTSALEACWRFQSSRGQPFPFKIPIPYNQWHYAESRRDSKGVKRGGVEAVYWDMCKLLWMEGYSALDFPPCPLNKAEELRRVGELDRSRRVRQEQAN